MPVCTRLIACIAAFPPTLALARALDPSGFLGAAMQSLMVGQMEAAGMKNMLPPGVTKRPSQGNIDFMKSNTDICQRQIPALSTITAKTDCKLPTLTATIERETKKATTPLFNDWVNTIQMCEAKREAIVKDAKAANVKGANVKLVLRPLVMAWEPPPFVVARWTGVCEDAQRYLIKQ